MRIARSCALAAALALSACPEARPPVDQVQANAIARSQFDGEWYFQRTVVDTPYETEFTFIGDQGELERIRWRIEENALVAVRSYDRITGADPDMDGDGAYEGAPVAAWPITSHFDIRREYNTTTGEETNVIVENDSDRPWYEREYVRVDWTQQLITNWNFYAPAAVELSPLAVATTDPNEPDAPRIEDGYLEITSAFFAQPITEVDPEYPEDGAIPLCWYFYRFDDCTASEVVVRNSFLRVEDRDYEPQHWTGIDMELFGYFDVSRPGYDEQYGPTNEGRERFQVRWNIWERSHDGRSCESDDECDDGTNVGSVCDELQGECTIPYRDREVRPIPYHTSPDLEPAFVQVAQEVMGQWNEGFRATVDGLRIWECIDDGGDPDTCSNTNEASPDVLVFCPNNPVQDGDPAACGPAGTAPRLGDIRYNLLWAVPQPGLGNPFGFGPAQVDPVTGEVVSAQALLYDAEMRSYAAWARDVVQLINGELDPEEYVDGENVREWVGARSWEEPPPPLTEKEAERLAGQVRLHHREALPHLAGGERSAGGRVHALREAHEALRQHPALSAGFGQAGARLSALIGSPIEQSLVDDESLITSAVLPGTPLSEEVLDRASPLRRLHDQKLRRAHQARMRRNSQRCAYFREFVDPSVTGYAEDYAGVDSEEIRFDILLGVWRGTAAHEMGHTLGLRHNLEGSADPFNYGPQYWALRDDGDVGPRYTDPESQDEIDGRIREYQYSSVMDYLSRFNSDSLGAKRYDHAAIKFGYGRLLEVLTDPVAVEDGWIANDIYLSQLFGYPGALLYDEDDALFSPHYSDFPYWFGDLEARRDVPQRHLEDYWAEADYWETPHTAYLATSDGEPIAPYKFCSDEFAGSGITCLYYDEGADLYEIPTDIATRYEAYYLFHNFARDRLWFSPDGHVWRIWDTYFDPLVGLNQWWVINASDLYATEEPGDDIDGFLTRYDGYGPFTLGVRESFDAFARTLARPEPGGYELGVDTDGLPAWLPAWWSEDLYLSIEEGRYFSTEWDYDQGYWWDDAIHHVGFFADKVLAMEALFDPTTYFLGQDSASDLRGYRVNYGSNFFDPLMDLVGDLMVGEKQGFAPYELDGEVMFPDYADFPVTMPDDAVVVDPNAAFSLQLHCMVLGLALLPDTFQSEIIDSTRIWLDGASDAIGTENPTVSHTDEQSGLTWVAVSYPDEDGEEKGVAARMVARANNLAAELGTLQELAAESGDEEEAAEAAEAAEDVALSLALHRENLNLLRAIHLELGALDF
jgi:hypothetical protein